MPFDPVQPRRPFCLALAGAVVSALRATATRDDLVVVMKAVAREMGFRHYALIHHDDFRAPRPDRTSRFGRALR